MTEPQSSFLIRARGGSGSTEKRVTGSLLIPRIIDVSTGIVEGPHETEEIIKVYPVVNRRRAFPLVNFGVAICKREPARAAMVRSWQIAPTARVYIHDEKAVVDRVRMFIDCQPSH